jgi:hypothetical protein
MKSSKNTASLTEMLVRLFLHDNPVIEEEPEQPTTKRQRKHEMFLTFLDFVKARKSKKFGASWKKRSFPDQLLH